MGWPAATVGFTFCDLWRLQDAPQATLYHGRDLSVQKRQAARRLSSSEVPCQAS
jgi:hypothetical protein